MGNIVKYKLRRICDADEVDTQVTEMLRDAIIDEYDAIRKYENYYRDIEQIQKERGKDYSQILKCIQDVINEEKEHVGEFNEMIKVVFPEEYELFQEGQKEVIKIIKNN